MKEEKTKETPVVKEPPTPKVKSVRNRNSYKVELLINGEVVAFPPHSTVEVPEDAEIPSDMGLYVR